MSTFKRKRIIDPVLGFRFYLQYGGSEYEAYKWFEKLFEVRVPLTVNQHFDINVGSFGENPSQPYAGLIWLTKDCGGSTMAHEVAHAVTNVCRVLNMNPVNADEFYASYLGWLFKEVNLFIRKK